MIANGGQGKVLTLGLLPWPIAAWVLESCRERWPEMYAEDRLSNRNERKTYELTFTELEGPSSSLERP